MQKKYFLVVFLIFFLQSFSSQSQEPWSLEQCIKYAFDNNIQIKQQMLYVKSGEGNLFQSKMGLIPSLNATGSQSFNYDRAIGFSNNQPINGDLKNTSVSLSANVSLFKGLQEV